MVIEHEASGVTLFIEEETEGSITWKKPKDHDVS